MIQNENLSFVINKRIKYITDFVNLSDDSKYLLAIRLPHIATYKCLTYLFIYLFILLREIVRKVHNTLQSTQLKHNKCD